MEMEDHNDNHHSQFGIDLRQFLGGRPAAPHFPTAAIPQQPAATAAELFSGHRSRHHHQLPPQQPHHHHHQYDMNMMMQLMPGRDDGLHDFRSAFSINACVVPSANSESTAHVAASSTPALSGLEAEAAGSFGGGDGGTGRWPRQETLTLLEIRSRLDSKFKEANQKGPLWDEVSRIMSEEHGYQRSGKKCREKFENLYKYYKKTKEGKAGRQDGKHYRFFRQLEALYGETSNAVSNPESHFVGNSVGFHAAANTSTTQANQEIFHSQKLCDSLSLSSSSEFDTSSFDEDNDLSTATLAENDSTEKRRRRRGKRSWKTKIKEFIDSQMRKLMERQEAWLEKLNKTLEQKEQERMLREEEWRKQEAARLDKEHKFWAKERAWIESRDAALMDALRKLTGREINVYLPEELVGAEIHNHSENQNDDGSDHTMSNSVKCDNWSESEITRLIQFRTGMDSRFQRSGSLEEVLWEEIAAKMASFGYERSAVMCKDKWDSINILLRKPSDFNKKRKESSKNCYFQSNEHIYNQGGVYCDISEEGPETVVRIIQSNEASSPANSNAGNAVNDSCFRLLMGDGENLWENYGLKLSKGDQSQ